MDAPLEIPRPQIDPRLLQRAARPGRVRGIALDAYVDALARPGAAGGIFRRALRSARALHSRERRFVSDVLFALVRHQSLIDAALETTEPAARWLGWLIHLGLPIEDAMEAWAGLEQPGKPNWHAAASLSWTGPRDAAHVARVAAVPEPVGAQLLEAYGEQALQFVSASNARAPIVLRVARGKIDAAEVVAQLQARGIEARAGKWAPDAVCVPTGTDLRQLDLYRRGLVELQDEASQLVVELVDPDPGDRVWDVCAGAGGKTLALAQRRGSRGRVVASDVRGRALGELQRRAKRAKLRGIRTVVLRDEGPSTDLGGPFDRVLVDAPCSGSGVWRRHPELRWRLSDLDAITALQDKILRDAARHVRPGGRLVYATCSVLPAECEARVAAFVRDCPAFRVVPAVQVVSESLRPLMSGPYLRTSPHEHGVDGFFGAVLELLG